MTKSIIKSIFAGAAFVASSLLTNVAIAQNGAVNSAEFFILPENAKYEKALEKIREASYHEKTKDKAKTWYVRAKVFTTIFEIGAEDEKIAALVTNPVDSAFASMKKALELEKAEGKDTYTKRIEDPVFQSELGMETGLQARLKNSILNQVQKYQDTKDFTKAYEAMIPLVTYNPNDTTNLIYIGYFADKAEKLDKSAMYYEKLGDMEEYNSMDAYQSAAYAYSRLEDTTNILRVLDKASKRYPQDPYFMLTSVNIYIKKQNYDKAIEMLEKAYAIEPEKDHLVTIARLYDQKEDSKKAMEYYKKVLEADPQDYDVAYTIGAYYYKNALSEYNELEQKDRAVTNPKMKTVLENAELAIPYFKKAIEINDEDKSLYNALRQLYNIKDDQKNVELMKKKVEGK